METTTTVTHRHATVEDLPFVYEALKRLAQEQNMMARFKHTPDSLRQLLFHDTIAEAIITELNDMPVSICVFSKTFRNFTLFDKPGLYLHDIYVLPEYRRQGIATHLIKYLTNLAREQGCGRIDWVALKKNDKGMGFYQSVAGANKVDYIDYIRLLIN